MEMSHRTERSIKVEKIPRFRFPQIRHILHFHKIGLPFPDSANRRCCFQHHSAYQEMKGAHHRCECLEPSEKMDVLQQEVCVPTLLWTMHCFLRWGQSITVQNQHRHQRRKVKGRDNNEIIKSITDHLRQSRAIINVRRITLAIIVF